MASQWRASKEIHKWTIKRSCTVYQQKFDSIFDQITKLSYADDLLSGIKYVPMCMHIILCCMLSTGVKHTAM